MTGTGQFLSNSSPRQASAAAEEAAAHLPIWLHNHKSRPRGRVSPALRKKSDIR
jgi:hypothetical protein